MSKLDIFLGSTLLGMFICINIIAWCATKETPSANDLADGKAWAEYTSDGQRHWVWRKQ